LFHRFASLTCAGVGVRHSIGNLLAVGCDEVRMSKSRLRAELPRAEASVRNSCALFFAGKLESRNQDAGFRALNRTYLTQAGVSISIVHV
jgi:hypothetical protein